MSEINAELVLDATYARLRDDGYPAAIAGEMVAIEAEMNASVAGIVAICEGPAPTGCEAVSSLLEETVRLAALRAAWNALAACGATENEA